MAIICHCEIVRERTIVKAIHRGAVTLDQVRAECGAASRCHGCEAAVVDLLERHAPANASTVVVRGSSVTVGASA